MNGLYNLEKLKNTFLIESVNLFIQSEVNLILI